MPGLDFAAGAILSERVVVVEGIGEVTHGGYNVDGKRFCRSIDMPRQPFAKRIARVVVLVKTEGD